MKNSTFFITLSFIMLSSSLFAQSKVAHINTQGLISEMPEVIAAQKELQEMEKTLSADVENSVKEFQTKAQTYAADSENQTETVNQSRQRELETMQQGIQEFRQTASQELQKKQNDLMRPLFEKARVAIETVAKAQGFDYVLDSSPGGSVIMAQGKDLMADVKKELGF